MEKLFCGRNIPLILFFVVAAITFVQCVKGILYEQEVRQRATETTVGHVVSCDTVWTDGNYSDDRGSFKHKAIVEYTAIGGAVHSYSFYPTRHMRAGTEVDVTYDPENPDVRADSGYIMECAVIMAVSVLVMLLTGAGCFGYGPSAWIRWLGNRGK